MFVPLFSYAYDAKIGGIYYSFKEDYAAVTYDGANCYAGDITIPSSVTYNGKVYPVKTIYSDCFWSCPELTSVNIPKTVVAIGSYVFCHCPKLVSINVEDGNPKYWSQDGVLFSNTDGIALEAYPGGKNGKYTIPNGVTNIPSGAFQGCAGLTSVIIPNSVTDMGYNVFQESTNLESVTFGNSIARIPDQSFEDCINLKTISLGSNVEIIGENAFYNCTKIRTIYCYATEPPSFKDDRGEFLSDVESYATLHVLKGHTKKYASALGWDDFVNIVDDLEEVDIKISSIKINKSSITMTVGESQQLIATISPETATYQVLSWGSSDSDVATVSRSGEVTAISPGTVTITCTARDGSGVKASCKVTVNAKQEVKPTSIALSPSAISVEEGKTVALTYTLTPANATASVTWKSDDTSIATVSASGIVKGVKAGSTNIRVTTDNGKTAYCVVTVRGKGSVEPTSISLSYSAISIEEGETRTLKYTLKPTNAAASVTWKSDDTSIATVSASGVVKGIKEGITNVWAITDNGKTAYCNVTVNPKWDGKPKSISLPSSKFIKEGETETLQYTLTPTNSTTSVTWRSEDTSIATVSASGVVKGIKAGNTNIWVTTDNGKAAYCYVTIEGPGEGNDKWSSNNIYNWGKLDGTGLECGYWYTIPTPVADEYLDEIKVHKWSTDGGPNIYITEKSSRSCTIETRKAGSCRLYCYVEFDDGEKYEGYYEFLVVGSTDVQNISLNISSATLATDESLQLVAAVNPDYAEHRNVTWQSSDTNVATVSSSGLVTAKGTGKATITCTSTDGSKVSATCEITVRSKFANYEITTSAAGYATFYSSESAYELPDGLSAQIVSTVSVNRLSYSSISEIVGSRVVPKGVPVVLVSENKRSETFTLVPSNFTTNITVANWLSGSDEATTITSNDSYYYYKLTYGDSGKYNGVFGWYWGAPDGAGFQIEGHKAWLALPKSMSTRSAFYLEDVTGMDSITPSETTDAYYDLQGRRISQPITTGVYIHNGKKVVIK